MEESLLLILPLISGYLFDLLLADPEWLPHPVRLFGNIIYAGEKWLNKGAVRFLKGMLLTIVLCTACFLFFYWLSAFLLHLHLVIYLIGNTIFVFYGLANKSLINEGRKVFYVLQLEGLEAGRRQLSRIVGRDTSNLHPQQIRIAVLETISENLSDGVIAPLFYYAIAGVPGMMTYKMINTLDSMIGYRNERYEQFGKFSARLDDVANFLPARITALLMAFVSFKKNAFHFIVKYSNKHKSPNSGYPEAALAGILDTRFGGPNMYNGIKIDKPFIGINNRQIAHNEIDKASAINHKVCFLAIVLMIVYIFIVNE